MNHGVILYGAPATGKDTITEALIDTGGFTRYERMKHGPGRTTGYRLVDQETLAKVLDTPGEAVWVTERYGSTYVVDREHLAHVLKGDLVPVMHLGQPEAIDAVKTATPHTTWLVVELICPRNEGVARIIARSTGDTKDRITAFDSTPLLMRPDVRINTAATAPAQAAQAIRAQLSARFDQQR